MHHSTDKPAAARCSLANTQAGKRLPGSAITADVSFSKAERRDGTLTKRRPTPHTPTLFYHMTFLMKALRSHEIAFPWPLLRCKGPERSLTDRRHRRCAQEQWCFQRMSCWPSAWASARHGLPISSWGDTSLLQSDFSEPNLMIFGCLGGDRATFVAEMLINMQRKSHLCMNLQLSCIHAVIQTHVCPLWAL